MQMVEEHSRIGVRVFAARGGKSFRPRVQQVHINPTGIICKTSALLPADVNA